LELISSKLIELISARTFAWHSGQMPWLIGSSPFGKLALWHFLKPREQLHHAQITFIYIRASSKKKAHLNGSEGRKKGFLGLGYTSLFTSMLPRLTGL
jgi:hypothetical protein